MLRIRGLKVYEKNSQKRAPTRKKRLSVNKETEIGELGKNIFEVEAILNKRTKHGVLEYFIKWSGYANTENSWEPQSGCHCPDRVNAFEESRKAKVFINLITIVVV